MQTTQVNFDSLLSSARSFYSTGATRPIEFRLEALSKLRLLVRENTDAICQALYADLRKPEAEALLSEVAVVLDEIRVTERSLRKWMKPTRVSSPLTLLPSRAYIYKEPLGLVLIIGPWNYPFQLLMAPLVGAIAAGNCVVLKPSEMTSNTAKLVSRLVLKYFDAKFISVVEGGIEETTELLKNRFDHIFFTGSTAVGKVIMSAAAKHLTPVTLELGGKSPAIVCEDADLKLAARRLVWGKFYNSGQTCVAPDYIYLQNSIEKEFLELVTQEIESQFGKNQHESTGLGRIVNARNLERLSKLISPGKVHYGGQTVVSDLYLQPTVLCDVDWEDEVMKEEVFGPLMPTLTFENFDEVLQMINSKPKPLAAYLFTRSKQTVKSFVQKVSFGGGCINDVLLHLSNPHLPFGGVGESGTGSYHGQQSFKTFSHSKSVLHRTNWLDVAARYAPYDDRKLRMMRKLFGV